jgi:hypothetical protein
MLRSGFPLPGYRSHLLPVNSTLCLLALQGFEFLGGGLGFGLAIRGHRSFPLLPGIRRARVLIGEVGEIQFHNLRVYFTI